jgi:hypothetical protein
MEEVDEARRLAGTNTGALALAKSEEEHSRAARAVGLGVVAFVGLCIGVRLFAHYEAVPVPALGALMVALGCWAWRRLK